MAQPPRPVSLFGRVAVVAATQWEIRGLISALGLRRSGPEYRDPEGTFRIRVSGLGLANAKGAAEALLQDAPTLVLCAGFAGALRPDLRAGDLVLDSERSDPEAARVLAETARRAGLPFHRGPFLCSPRPLMTAAEKAEAAARTGAIAVEMESQAVFEACRARGTAFCSLRAVSDASDQGLPSLVMALDSSGRTGARFWKAFLAHPSEWPAFFRLAASSRKAGAALTRALSQLPREVPR